MNEVENFDQLFSPQVDMGGSSKVSDEYKVSAEKGKGGIYQSVIRFIPYWQNPKNSIQEKWVSWLIDPVTQKGRFVDCPSSVGKPSPLQDMYWKLKKSESVLDQRKADIFSRRHNFGALIQVIKDDNQPELEGKILYFSFGKKIWEKIDAEMKPIIGSPHNPFDLLKGKVFALVVSKVSGFNNYDQSKFVDTIVPLCMPDANNKLVPINDRTDKQLVFNFLKENSPDVTKYLFKEWDSETKDYVNHVITAVTGQVNSTGNYGSVQETIHSSTPTNVTVTPRSNPSGSNITVNDIHIESSPIGEASMPFGNLPQIDNIPDLPSIGNIGIGNIDDLMRSM